MFKTLTEAKTYYENCGRVKMAKPEDFSELELIEELYIYAGTVEQAEAILEKNIPD
ncbi:MAG: hypothetical protein GX180_08820 [Enterococcus sp.]|nr:hypothetical protein [Enterococcus sp.]